MKCWGKFFTSKVVVNCKTEEEVKSFFQECKKLENSITLVAGRHLSEYNEDDFETYGADTCFLYETLTPNNAPVLNETTGISYCSIEWAKEHNYEIIVYD
ncbi:hypothetical protein FDA48_05910 [Clostridium botulinum]|nr:hypothetical protein [Clostridium botulinum]